MVRLNKAWPLFLQEFGSMLILIQVHRGSGIYKTWSHFMLQRQHGSYDQIIVMKYICTVLTLSTTSVCISSLDGGNDKH